MSSNPPNPQVEVESYKTPSPLEIDEAKTVRGAWTRKQLGEWGVAWPPPRGWRKELRRRYYAGQTYGPRITRAVLEIQPQVSILDAGLDDRLERD